MSWEDAHRYNQALRDVRAELEWLPDIEQAWRSEYWEIFGSPERLVLALRSRWHTTLQAQVEDIVTEDGGPSGIERALTEANAGLVRALTRAGAIRQAEPWLDEALLAGPQLAGAA